MPKKKQTEIEKMEQSFQTATGMKVIPGQEPPQGTTEFAKDTMKDVPVIPSGIEGKK